MSKKAKNALQIIIMAAGKGTRMRSDLAKVLHPLLGKPMIFYVVSACLALKPQRLVVVTGHQAASLEARLQELFAQDVNDGRLRFARQNEQLGTGHAVWSALPQLLEQDGITCIVNGDGPLITAKTLQQAIDQLNRNDDAPLVGITFEPEDAHGYGRVVRDAQGRIERVVEERDASAEEKRLREVASGIYAVRTNLLRGYVQKIMGHKTHHEYYLTDMLTQARQTGAPGLALMAADPQECNGINTPEQLAAAETILVARQNLK